MLLDADLLRVGQVFGQGVESASALLEELLGVQCGLVMDECQVVPPDRAIDVLCDEFPQKPLVSVELRFCGELPGTAMLAFHMDMADKLVHALIGADGGLQLDSGRSETLLEIGNILLNAIMGTVGNISGLHFRYAVPTYVEVEAHRAGIIAHGHVPDAACVVVRTRLELPSLDVCGPLLLCFAVEEPDVFVRHLSPSKRNAA